MADNYNQRVKLKKFNIGDLVLWKVTLETKDQIQGKLGPTWESPLQDHPLLKTRKLPFGIHGWEEITSFMEY